MKYPERILYCILSLFVLFSFSGCGKNKIQQNSQEDFQSSSTANRVQPVDVKSYSFPEFLKNSVKCDALTRKIYTDFDESTIIKNIDTQPFEKYVCDKCIANLLYTYYDGKYCGILDKNGNVLLKADKYSSVGPAKNGVIVLSYPEKMHKPDDYMKYDKKGSLTSVKLEQFSTDKIKVVESKTTSDDGKDNKEKKCYEIQLPDGKKVSENGKTLQWDIVKPCQLSDIDTSKDYRTCYKCTKDDSYFYVCFDKYFNFTVYEGEYARIKLKTGSDFGECYILSRDDYTELVKMTEGFGETDYFGALNGDISSDFIEITFGLNTESIRTVTISPEGYCFTQESGNESKPESKFFSCLDRESFVSLVKWLDTVASKEYSDEK